MGATPLNNTLRRLFRAPVYLYRWKCGRLLGHRFLLLIHVGRRTGLRRYTVLEVMEYRTEGPQAVVMSAFGRNADWLRNIEATPGPEVVIGSQHFVASHHFLGSGAADAAAAVPFVSRGIMLWSFGGICGYIAFGFICDTIGRRLTVILYSAGTIVCGLILYLALPAYEPWYPLVLPIFGFFVFGVFSGYAVYLPELFPTHIRSTAVGFCTGTARIITSFGPLVAGLLVGAFGGSFNRVTAFMTCFALLSILAMLLGRETKGTPLPR